MQYHYGYIKFKDRVHDMFCPILKVLHNKNVNTIPSCAYINYFKILTMK